MSMRPGRRRLALPTAVAVAAVVATAVALRRRAGRGQAAAGDHGRRETPRRESPSASGGVRSLSRRERIGRWVEHEADTRSVGLAAGLYRLTKGRISGLAHRRVLLLTTRGRKSGLDRTVPLQFFPDGDRMIVVAANSGLPSPPAWYLNLTADPRARVEVMDRTLRVCAEELSPAEAAAFWPRVLETAPDYARYPERTSRRIPLLRLLPVPDNVQTKRNESRTPTERGQGSPADSQPHRDGEEQDDGDRDEPGSCAAGPPATPRHPPSKTGIGIPWLPA